MSEEQKVYIDGQTTDSGSNDKKSHKKIFILLFLAILALGIGIFVYYYANSNKSPFDKYENTIGFQLYYPTTLPNEYILDNESIRNNSGVLFFTLKKSDNSIVVSQQKAPDTPPDFDKLKESLNFKDIDTEIGDAVSGLNAEKPTAILVTNTTLITVNGSKDVPSDVVIDLVKNMRSL